MKEYEPFGKEWEAELMKVTKKQIIDLLRETCIKALKGGTSEAIR